MLIVACVVRLQKAVCFSMKLLRKFGSKTSLEIYLLRILSQKETQLSDRVISRFKSHYHHKYYERLTKERNEHSCKIKTDTRL